MSYLRALALAAAVLAVGTAARAQPASGPAASAAISDKPAQYAQASIADAKKYMTGRYTGDSWTWHARFPMYAFIDSYLATRDRAWLDAAVEYFDWCISLLETGPDGKKGWLGPAYQMPGRLGEYPLEDALVLTPMVRFAELVLKDEPALAEKYGKSAGEYVRLTKELAFEKWRQRGIWREDGEYGVFTAWPWTYTEKEPNRWAPPPAGTPLATLPINMQVVWGVAAARLHRVTGEEKWRQQAGRIFNFAKSRLNLYDDHYSWNYWEPFGPWDIRANNPQDFYSWINTHPYRNYQLGEVEAFVEAYNHGITFDAEDMKRLVRTNTRVMWNGSLDKIEWNNSNAGVQKAALGEVRLPTTKPGEGRAGALWPALAPLDATVRAIYEKQLAPGTYQHAYYHNVTARRAPEYARKYADDKPAVLDFPFHACSTITMAAAIPSVVARGKSAVAACQGRLAGDLKVELRSADGERNVATLKEVKASEMRPPFLVNVTWSVDVPPGRYRFRWTLKGEYREFPIEVR